LFLLEEFIYYIYVEMSRNVLLEAIAIGVILLIIYIVIHMAMMGIAPKFSMTHTGMFLGVFLAGALGHLAFEATGANKEFCNNF